MDARSGEERVTAIRASAEADDVVSAGAGDAADIGQGVADAGREIAAVGVAGRGEAGAAGEGAGAGVSSMARGETASGLMKRRTRDCTYCLPRRQGGGASADWGLSKGQGTLREHGLLKFAMHGVFLSTEYPMDGGPEGSTC